MSFKLDSHVCLFILLFSRRLLCAGYLTQSSFSRINRTVNRVCVCFWRRCEVKGASMVHVLELIPPVGQFLAAHIHGGICWHQET